MYLWSIYNYLFIIYYKAGASPRLCCAINLVLLYELLIFGEIYRKQSDSTKILDFKKLKISRFHKDFWEVVATRFQ